MRKCNDVDCTYHKPIRGNGEVTIFPDPVPKEIDNVLHYEPGCDPEEKFLPSKLEDIEKCAHNIPFPPTAQTAKNVGFTIKCFTIKYEECSKSRLLHSKMKAKEEGKKGLKRIISKLSYMCRSIGLSRNRK